MTTIISNILRLVTLIICFSSCKEAPSQPSSPENPVVISEKTKPVEFEFKQLKTAETEAQRLAVIMRPMDFHSTGLMARANAKLKIKIDLLEGKSLPMLLVGTYSRYVGSVYDPAEYQLLEGTNEYEIKEDGILWVRFNSDDELGRVRVTFVSGFENVPHYKLGKTTNSEWKQFLSKTNSPDVILEGGRAIVVVSKESALKYQNENQDQLLEKITEVINIQDDYSGLDGSLPIHQRVQHSKFLMVQHDDPSDFLYATYYRTAYINSAIGLILSVDQVVNEGWGLWHELGHQHQQNWTWDAIGEATVNIYSRQVQRKFQPTTNRLKTEGAWTRALAYVKSKHSNKNFNNDGQTDVWVRLCMFEQLNLAFGNDFYLRFHKQVRVDVPKLENDVQKMDYFMKTACQVSNTNLSDFFKIWGLNLGSDVYSTIEKMGLNKPSQEIHLLTD